VIGPDVLGSGSKYQPGCWACRIEITDMDVRLVIVDIGIDIVSDVLCQ
jgi:hypothetical protein